MREDDLAVLFEHQCDAEAARLAAFTPRDHDAFLRHWHRLLADPRLIQRAVLADGHVAGHVGAFDSEGRREIGYWIGREYWGRGVASRAVELFLEEIRERPLHAWVAAHNPASLRVLLKVGFRVVDRGPAAGGAGAAGVQTTPVEGITLRLDARRVAALYDVHGNLPALEAALAAAESAGADAIVVGGDVVLGPMPRETLDRLLALGPRARFLRGNCDRLVVDAFDGRPLTGLPPAVLAPIAWTAARLDRSHRDFLAGLPGALAIRVQGLGPVLFCHATARSDDEIFTVLTPVERVRPMFEGVAERLVVCGHTHMQFDRTVDSLRLVNAGSVGMPFGSRAACWLLLGPEPRLMETEYDAARAAERLGAGSYPGLSRFLDPGPAEEALRRFESGPLP